MPESRPIEPPRFFTIVSTQKLTGIVLAGLSAAGGLFFLALFAGGLYAIDYLRFGNVITQIPMSEAPTTTPLVIAGNRSVQIALHASELAAGDACKRLAVELELANRSGNFWSSSFHGWTFLKSSDRRHSDTRIKVDTVDLPPGGIERVQASYRFEPAGCGGRVEGLVLQFREPRL